jgi:general secretion pathway protein D
MLFIHDFTVSKLRSIVILLLALSWSSLMHANDINISTVTQNGTTIFYLQAGAFNLEKDARLRQKKLAKLVEQKIEIKNLADKHLYLVQIGPIEDYLSARALKDKLSVNASDQPFKTIKIPPSSITVSQQPPTVVQTQELPPSSKLWNLRNADVRAVIAEVSRVIGKNFVIDPRVQGKVSMVSSTPMTNQELYQVFLSVLQVSGYAAIPSGDIIKIIPNIDAKSVSPDQMNYHPEGDEMMVTVVPVHYVPAEQLVPVLRPLMPQWSNVSAYAPSNMLILSGRASNIQSLSEIIKQVDSSNATGIDMVPLRHALAMDVANTLKDLVKVQPNIGSRSQITIAADDRSNSLLISGNRTDRIRLRMLILKLDKENSEGANSNTQVVYLSYLRAEDLVPILAGIAQANFSGNVGTTIGTVTVPILDSTNPVSSIVTDSSGSASGQSSQPTPTSVSASLATANTSSANTQNEGSTKPTVQIIAEPNTNSIIINAPVAIIRILKKVISQLDIKPDQLLIEALVAEVDENNINNLGIEWGSDSQTGNPRDFRAGFAIINTKTRVDDFQARIYALAREQKANILSTPSVVVLDNRQAKILVGKQVSIASTTQPSNANGTTNGGTPFTTFNRVNVALHLYVRPQITRGQGIQMQIDQGNDTLDPASTIDSITTPTFKISSIVTSVHVESGDIVVLGGLTQNSLGEESNRVPILGDIPGLGKLFQHNIPNRAKRVLMVFIKPIILRNERDNLHVTGEKYNDARQYQLEWVRSQDAFDKANAESVLPPLTQATLPRPFTLPPKPIQQTK